MSITPNPFLNDDKKRLEQERKHDEEVFLERKRLQEKERADQHKRAVNGKISDLERDLDRKRLALRAILAETPSLESRIRVAKRTEFKVRENDSPDEDTEVRSIEENIRHLKETERNLQRELQETKEKERDEEASLSAHARKHDEVLRKQAEDARAAVREEQVAKERLESKKHDGTALEAEIRKVESDIAALKREIQ